MNKNQRFIAAFLFLLFTSLSVFAQSDYTVIKVYGDILLKKDNRSLNQGDRFSDKDVLVFRTTESKAAVVHPEKGRLIISEASGGSKSNFVPAMSNVSTRGVNVTTASDLINEFKGNYIFFNKVNLKVNPNLFPLGENSFFFIRYTYEGETINKRLGYTSDTVIINKDELLRVDGTPVDAKQISEMKLFFMKDKKTSFICAFNPVFPEMELLKKEIQIIAQTLSSKDKLFLIDEIEAYLIENYGKFDKTDLRVWLNTFM